MALTPITTEKFESSTIGTQKTIRDFISNNLVDHSTDQDSAALVIHFGEVDKEKIVYEVDLLWSGQEYLISYKKELTVEEIAGSDTPAAQDEGAETPTATSTISPFIVERLVDVLPISFYPIKKSTDTTT